MSPAPDRRAPFLRVWGPGFAVGLLAALAAVTGANAQICLPPDRLEQVLGDDSLRDLERAHRQLSRMAENSDVCRREDQRLCPVRPGIYALWSNNAAAYWVGPLSGGKDELAHVERRLGRLSEIARSVAGGDYADAARGPVAMRRSECVHAHETAGQVAPQLLYAIGREATRLKRARETAADLATRLRRSATSLDELQSTALQMAEQLVEDAFAPAEQAAAESLPLGRAGDGLLHRGVEGDRFLIGGGPGSARDAAISGAFARWVAKVTAAAAPGEVPGILRRLALLAYMQAPRPFEDLAAHAAPTAPPEDADDPSLYFDAIAAEYRALDALARFADARAEDGALRVAMAALADFEQSLPGRLRRAITETPQGRLFALQERADAPDLPGLDRLQPVLVGGAESDTITADTEAAARRLGRAGLAAAARRLAQESGVPLNAVTVSDDILAGTPKRLAGSVLRSLLTEAFAGDPKTIRHIEALAAGAFDRFAAGLLANTMRARLAEATGDELEEGVFREVAGELVGGTPAQAYLALSRAAVRGLGPAWRRAMGALLDGRVGAAARLAVRTALIEAGIADRLVRRLLEDGAAGAILDARLTERLGLPSDQLAALEAGEAPDYVRSQAASVLDAPELAGQALRDRLAAERRQIERTLLTQLDPADSAGIETLAALGDPARRRALARSLFTERLGASGAAEIVLSQAALEALMRGDRAAAMQAGLTPLLSEVPGGAPLIEARSAPYRRGVAKALREAVAGQLGEEAAEAFMDDTALAHLRAGAMERLGRAYAGRVFETAGLDRETRRHLLDGEVTAAWQRAARIREDDQAGGDAPIRRLERSLWRAQAAIDLRQLALERRRRIYGVSMPDGDTAREVN